MVGDRFSSSTSCSGWLHETAPARPDSSLSCLFLKVATHPCRFFGSSLIRLTMPFAGRIDLDAPQAFAGRGICPLARYTVFVR